MVSILFVCGSKAGLNTIFHTPWDHVPMLTGIMLISLIYLHIYIYIALACAQNSTQNSVQNILKNV